MNAPKLRFPEFHEDWEAFRLNDLCREIIVPMRDKPKRFDGSIPWCRIEDVQGRYLYDSLSNQQISEEIVGEMNLKIVPSGTVLCSCSASLGVYAIAKQPLVTNQTFIGLVCSDKVENEFLLDLMKTKTSLLESMAGGTTIKYISRKTFENLLVFIPNLREQSKLVEFIQALDKKIALAERKLIAIDTLKSSLKNKIFNQKVLFKDSNSNTFPTWQEFNFFDLVESITDFRGRTPKKLGMEWAKSPTNYITLSALNVKSWGIDYSTNFHYGDEDLYKKWMTKSELHKGQVIMTTEAPAGVVMQIPDHAKYILGQRVIALNLKSNLVSEGFFAQLLRSDNVQNDIRKLSSGGTALGISQKSLKGLNLMLPTSLEEQEKISTLLKLLDDKIQTTKRKIDRLHALKRGLLQKMFV